MIYVIGTEKITGALAGYELTDDPDKASCTIIEMPGNYDQLVNMPDALVVVTGMVTLKDWRLIENRDWTTIDSLPDKIKSIISTQNQLLEEIPELEVPEPLVSNAAFNNNNQSANIKPRPRHADLFSRDYHSRGRIIASFSASGGVGKTFSAINIGGFAAIEGLQTVVADLDFGFGDVDTATGLVDPARRDKVIDRRATGPKSGWATVVSWRNHARDLKGNLLRHNSGLYVLPSYPYAGNDMSEVEIEDLLLTLSEQFELVVVDLGVDAFSPHARAALKLASTVFLIGGQDEKTIGKLTQFLASKDGHIEKMKLVINMVQPTGYYTPREIARKLSFNTYEEIPLDVQGVNAAKKANKLPVQLGGCSSGEAVKQIASRHLQIAYEQTTTRKTFLSGLKLFSRRA